MSTRNSRVFRVVWWLSNLLLVAALVLTVYSGAWALSVRQYLRGFSGAVVPQSATPQQKGEAILAWMRGGSPRLEATGLSPCDPEDTLNYPHVLEVCGSATNAFLNLSPSAGLEIRRLLLLTPQRRTKHVVADVLLDGRWVIVDASYRRLMKDAAGNLLTRRDLQDPKHFREATEVFPNYPPEYNSEHFAHVRLAALPLHGAVVRRVLDFFLPGWDKYLDGSLLLERRSFLFLFCSVNALTLFLLLRLGAAWAGDHHLRVPRFRLRESISRATSSLFATPEIK